MILAQFIDGSSVYNMSVVGHGGNDKWPERIVGAEDIVLSPLNQYGGYLEVRGGNIYLSPDTFGAGVAPPFTGQMEIFWTGGTDSSSLTTLIKGTATLMQLPAHREYLVYSIKPPEYDDEISEGQSYGGGDFADAAIGEAILEAIAEVTTADGSGGSINGHIQYTVPEDVRAIQLAAEMAAATTNLIWVREPNAYIWALSEPGDSSSSIVALSNGTRTVTKFDKHPPQYLWLERVATVVTTVPGSTDEARYNDPDFPEGREYSVKNFANNVANARLQLNGIAEVLNRDRARITLEMNELDTIPDPREKISWTDDEYFNDLTITAYIFATIFTYDIIRELLTIEGDGDISIA